MHLPSGKGSMATHDTGSLFGPIRPAPRVWPVKMATGEAPRIYQTPSLNPIFKTPRSQVNPDAGPKE